MSGLNTESVLNDLVRGRFKGFGLHDRSRYSELPPRSSGRSVELLKEKAKATLRNGIGRLQEENDADPAALGVLKAALAGLS